MANEDLRQTVHLVLANTARAPTSANILSGRIGLA
jgi:hypothetical protein